MIRMLKCLGLAVVAALAFSAFGIPATADFQPVREVASPTGEAAVLAFALIVISLLATNAIGTPRRGITGPPCTSSSDDTEGTATTARHAVLSHTDQRRAQRHVSQAITHPAGAH